MLRVVFLCLFVCCFVDLIFSSLYLNSTLLEVGLFSKLFSHFYIWVMRFTEGFLEDSQLLMRKSCTRASWGATSFFLPSFQNHI